MEKSYRNAYSDNEILFSHDLRSKANASAYRPHTHDVYELLLLKQGDITYSVNGKQYRPAKDDLIISRPSEIHNVQPANGKLYERYNILFDEKALPFDLRERLPKDLDVINLSSAKHITAHFDKMDSYFELLKGEELKLMLTSLAQQILMDVILETRRRGTENGYVQTNAVICDAIAYIDAHLTEITCIDELADALFITKSHLHHLFMRYMNISPKKYIVSKRLTLAKRMIYNGEKLTEVYEKCGFTDYSSFYRAYRKLFGKSPSDKTVNSIILEE